VIELNSPADKAGMLFADRVDELDNTVVGNAPDVCDILGSKSAGDSLKVQGQEFVSGKNFVTNARLR
jgi:hypothetical protein